MALNPKKIGVTVRCETCKREKCPHGRSAPLGLSYCHDDECTGYKYKPKSGCLWPGESEADFGYPVCDDGVEVLD